MKKGLTVLELMVAVVVMGILSTLAIPNIKNIKTTAQTEALRTNLNTISQAVQREYLNTGLYPLKSPNTPITLTTLPIALQEQILATGDTGEFLYELDMTKVNQNLTQSKQIDADEKLIVSTLTDFVYTTKGVTTTKGATFYGGTIPSSTNTKNLSYVSTIINERDASYALFYDGTVKSWGTNNSYGQMGVGSIEDTSRNPTKIAGLTNVREIISNGKSTFAVAYNNGNLEYYAWGKNDYGQLGIGTNTNQATPIKIDVLTNKVKEILISYEYLSPSVPASTYALLNDGTVMSWGCNTEGDLGLGDTVNRNIPTLVPGVTNVRDLVIPKYRNHQSVYAILNNDTVIVWGYNDETQLGIGWGDTYYPSPQVNPYLTNVKEIITDGKFGYAILRDETIMVWGANWSYQLGLNTTSYKPTPVVHTYLSNVKSMYVIEETTYALLKNNTLLSWGGNDYGQVGNNSTVAQRTPIQVLTDVKELFLNNSSVFALKTDGTVYAWGRNNYGQLGTGNTSNTLTPTLINGLKNTKSISTMAITSYAIFDDGTIKYSGKEGAVLNWTDFSVK